jgi:hypothetical protein
VEAFTRALEKARGEQVVAKAIENGMKVTAVWEKYGIM